MKVKALQSFSGVINMAKGDERDIASSEILMDLLDCGYVEAVEIQGAAENLPDITEDFPGQEEHPADKKDVGKRARKAKD